MNPEPMAYESTAPPLSYLATMPKDITRNRPKSQPISLTQILIIGTTQERSLRPELAILDFFRSPRRCAPRDDRFVVAKGLDPFHTTIGTVHPIRFANRAGTVPYKKHPLHQNGTAHPIRFATRAGTVSCNKITRKARACVKQ